MGSRTGPILLFVLVLLCTYANARSLVTVDILVMPMEDQIPVESEVSQAIASNTQVCTLCQDFAAQTLQYLNDNETQSEIISTLYQLCSHMHSFKHQCDLLVDYYVPLFFMEIAKIQPELFCEKMNLCEDIVTVRLRNRQNACTLCHRVLTEVLTKLQDPDTQLEIIETLLKACSKVENFVQECKKLVFQYGPLVLANAEKFLESTDICAVLHVCKASQEVASLGELLLSSA